MFSIFKKNKSSNLYYQKIEKLIKKKYAVDQFKSIYRLGGVEYNKNSKPLLSDFRYEVVINALNKFEYNSQSDNIEFYLLSSVSNCNKLLAIIDPIELWENEMILAEIDLPNKGIDLNVFEKIF